MSSSGRNPEEQQKQQQQQQQRRHQPGMSQETRQDRISEPALKPQGGQQQQQGERGRQPQQQQQSGSASGGGQYGEGNYKATREYDAGVKHHLETHDVEREARDAAPRSEQEKREIEQAEQLGKDKAKGMRDPKDDMKR